MTKRSRYRSRNAKALALRRFTLGFFFALSFVSFGYFEPWNWKNDPQAQWGGEVTVNYNKLVEEAGNSAHLRQIPWTNSFYPMWKGGFAVRDVNLSDRQMGPFTLEYKFHPDSELARMSEEELKALSGAEKLDIVNGRSSDRLRDEYQRALRERGEDGDFSDQKYYQFTRRMRRLVYPYVTDPRDELSQFSGWCQPLALASIHHPEPDLVRFTTNIVGEDGQKVVLPLTSSDIKGFMMMAYEDVMDNIKDDDPNYKMVDRRCYDRDSKYYNAENCRSMNAGTFHVILLNQIGRFGQGLVADFDPKRPIWNHPIEGYEVLSSRWYTDREGNYLRSRNASADSVREREFTTKMFFVKNSVGLHERAMGQDKIRENYYYSWTLHYRIELDANDNIVGGTWLEDPSDLVDFMWVYPKIKRFENDYSFLNGIVK